MPSRGSATPPDRGVGGGGGVSGQMTDTHTSNWLLAVVQRVDESIIRRQALMEEITGNLPSFVMSLLQSHRWRPRPLHVGRLDRCPLSPRA